MMRPMISVIAVVVLMVVATTMLWSRSASIELATAAMPPLQELHAMAGVHKLPVQEIEDQSLVYPNQPFPAKRAHDSSSPLRTTRNSCVHSRPAGPALGGLF